MSVCSGKQWEYRAACAAERTRPTWVAEPFKQSSYSKCEFELIAISCFRSRGRNLNLEFGFLLKRSDWMEGELAIWENPDTFALPDPQSRYMKIKNLRTLNPRNIAVLRELAAWREKVAVSRDCLAKSIVRDETLLEIARKMPTDVKDLSALRGFYHKEVAKSGIAIIKSVKRGKEALEGELPTLPESDGHSTTRGIEELLSAFVQIRSEELKIEPSVLADRKRIHSFATHFEQRMNMDEHFLLQGWRKECIGKPMLSLLNGEVGLKINPLGQVTLIPIK